MTILVLVIFSIRLLQISSKFYLQHLVLCQWDVNKRFVAERQIFIFAERLFEKNLRLVKTIMILIVWSVIYHSFSNC